MTASDEDQALQRFRIIRPFLEEGVVLAAIARHHGIPLRTARRWVSHYRTGGLAALTRAPRADKGSHRALSPLLQELVEALAVATPRRSVAAIHRTVSAVARDRGETPPGYAAVYALVRALDPALLTLAHDGAKVYSETYDLLYRREVDAPNAVWQADHTLLDMLVLDDKGVPARPWLSVIVDDYSRAIAGYFLSFNAPAAMQTALALHQAIWRKSEPGWTVCGIPAVLYTDHGSDFTSRHIEQVCADLKIRLVFSLPGKPRGRGRVERFFETVNQRFLADLPGYAPAGQTPRPPALTLGALDDAFRRFVLDDYHQTPHSATGMPPQTRWSSGGFLPHMPESLEQLDLLLLTVAKPRQVHQDGIRFQALRYIDPTLAAYVGESVTIRYDPRDMAEIRVYHANQFLCRAICPELATETISLKDIIAARNKRRRDLTKTLRESTSLVEALLGTTTRATMVALPYAPPTERPSEKPKNPLKRYVN
jgi:putative transposase